MQTYKVFTNKKIKNIEDVVKSLGILSSSVDQYGFNKMHPFVYTYFLVTSNVLENIHEYHDPDVMSRLDVEFAKLFLNPLEKYLLTHKKIKPWKTFFDYADFKDEYIPFVSLLLGINAHINGDLPIALLKVDYKDKEDYALVDDILLKLVGKVFANLVFHEHDYYGLGGLVFRDLARVEVENTVIRWREEAWQKYQKLKSSNSLSRLYAMRHINIETEEKAKKIIELFHLKNYLNSRKFINTLNKI